jgi:hypothetical protein
MERKERRTDGWQPAVSALRFDDYLLNRSSFDVKEFCRDDFKRKMRKKEDEKT